MRVTPLPPGVGDPPKQPMPPTHKLTDVKVKMLDGEGLSLLVQPQSGMLWRLKYRFGGKEKLLAKGIDYLQYRMAALNTFDAKTFQHTNRRRSINRKQAPV